MNQTKISTKAYGAWEYRREEEELNRQSENGWQLERGGCFYSKFKKNCDEHFIYAIDYQPNIADKERYVESFEEQGWRYVNTTFNGWNYFKKKYRQDMEEEEKKIYTDKQSLNEMRNRYFRLLLVLIPCMLFSGLPNLMIGLTQRRPANFLISVANMGFALVAGYECIAIYGEKIGSYKIPHIKMNLIAPFYFLLLVISMALIFID